MCNVPEPQFVEEGAHFVLHAYTHPLTTFYNPGVGRAFSGLPWLLLGVPATFRKNHPRYKFKLSDLGGANQCWSAICLLNTIRVSIMRISQF